MNQVNLVRDEPLITSLFTIRGNSVRHPKSKQTSPLNQFKPLLSIHINLNYFISS